MRLRGMIAATLFSAAMVGLGFLAVASWRRQGSKGEIQGPTGGRGRPAALQVDLKEPPVGLVKNPRFFDKSADVKIPAHYAIEGDVAWVWCGAAGEDSDAGIAFYSGKDVNKDGQRSAQSTASDRVHGRGRQVVPVYVPRARRTGLRGREGHPVHAGRVLRQEGHEPARRGPQNIYPLVERDRKELAANGKFFKNGGAVWKTYALEFRLPFAEIDTLAIGVGFKNGSAETGWGPNSTSRISL